jgi:hypothetical protein
MNKFNSSVAVIVFMIVVVVVINAQTESECIKDGDCSNIGQQICVNGLCGCPAGEATYHLASQEYPSCYNTSLYYFCAYAETHYAPGGYFGVLCNYGEHCCVGGSQAECYDDATQACCTGNGVSICDRATQGCEVFDDDYDYTSCYGLDGGGWSGDDESFTSDEIPTPSTPGLVPVFTIADSTQIISVNGSTIVFKPKGTTSNLSFWYTNATGYIINYQYRSLVLDVKGEYTTAGTPIIVWPAKGGQNQLWNFTTTDSGTEIISKQSGLYLKVDTGKLVIGNIPTIWHLIIQFYVQG